MSEFYFMGLPLDDEARAEALRHLEGTIRVVLALVVDSPTRPNPWYRLPKAIAWVISDPFDWAAVVSRTPLKKQPVEQDPLESDLAEAFGRQEVLVLDLGLDVAPARLPVLAPHDTPAPAWFDDNLEAIDDSLGAPVRSTTDLTALQAGILQVADHLTASHEHSQSIEGQGRHRAGDYWHAINHRREPDDGNAKYWFRSVGDHPLLKELGAIVPALAREFSSNIQQKAASLIKGGVLDPFRFVDLASEARRTRDPELTRFAERLQWIEMVQLLASNQKDAVT